MKPSVRSLSSLSLVVLVAVLAGGCTAALRERWLQNQAGVHVYRLSVYDIWPYVESLMGKEGYAFQRAPNHYELVTDWLETSAPSSLGTSYARYLVRGQDVGRGRSTVHFFRQVRVVAGPGPLNANGQREPGTGTDSNQATRDLELEWKLLLWVEPDTAQALQEESLKQYK